MTPVPIAGAQRAGAGRGDRKGSPGLEVAMIGLQRGGHATASRTGTKVRRRPPLPACNAARCAAAIGAVWTSNGAYCRRAGAERYRGAQSWGRAGMRQPRIAA